MVEPLVSYLEATVAAAACEKVIVFGFASCACLARRVLSSTTLSILRYFLRTTTATTKQKITTDELNARAKAKGYQRGAHRDKDSLRDRKKHLEKTKQIKMQRWIVTSSEVHLHRQDGQY
jgi:hypothetical protein